MNEIGPNPTSKEQFEVESLNRAIDETNLMVDVLKKYKIGDVVELTTPERDEIYKATIGSFNVLNNGGGSILINRGEIYIPNSITAREFKRRLINGKL